MKRLLLIGGIGLLVACSSNDCQSDNPYKESHIVDVMPHYQITPDANPKLKKPLEEMTEDELKTRYGELQRQAEALTPSQRKEFKMIADRLNQLESTNEREQTLYIKSGT